MADSSFEDEWASTLEGEHQTEKQTAEDLGQNGNLDDSWETAMKEQKRAKQEEASLTKQPEIDWAAALDEQRRLEKMESTQAASLAKQVKHDGLPQGMQILLKLPLEIAVRLGETKMLISDLLQLGQGSIIELNKIAGADMDVIVNGKRLGTGEVVVVNEHFGVRVTSISPIEARIRNLG
jgi:flagellar motor switch protein FliN